MTNRLLAGCCAVLLLAPVPALATEAASTTETPAAEAAPAKEKKICRRDKAASGTRVGTGRICKTQAEWDKLRAKAKEKGDRDRGA